MPILTRINIDARKGKGPLNNQVGGSHYIDYTIQPIEYAMANNLNACQANVVKYVTRYKDKGGVEDLFKAKHYIDMLIEREPPHIKKTYTT